MELNERELATVLAALHEYHGIFLLGVEPPEAEVNAIASGGGRFMPLNAEELHDLCDRIDQPPLPGKNDLVEFYASSLGIFDDVPEPGPVTVGALCEDVDDDEILFKTWGGRHWWSVKKEPVILPSDYYAVRDWLRQDIINEERVLADQNGVYSQLHDESDRARLEQRLKQMRQLLATLPPIVWGPAHVRCPPDQEGWKTFRFVDDSTGRSHQVNAPSSAAVRAWQNLRCISCRELTLMPETLPNKAVDFVVDRAGRQLWEKEGHGQEEKDTE